MTRRLPHIVLAATLVALTPMAASAQRAESKKKTQTVAADGTEMFRWLLHARGIKPVTEDEIWHLTPDEDLIVIVLGDPQQWNLMNRHPLEWADATVREGGAALVAADSYLALGSHVPRAPGLTITGSRVMGQQAHSFRQTRTLPLVVPWKKPPNGGPHWDLFQGLSVATNQPSYLRMPQAGSFVESIAGFPPDSWSGNQFLDARTPIAAAGSGSDQFNEGSYRFLVIADPSIFVNEMLLQSPDNLEFAYRVTGYLQGDGRKRRQCLFIQNGRMVSEFDALKSVMGSQLPPIPMPKLGDILSKVVDIANQAADKYQEKGGPSTTFFGNPEDGPSKALRSLVTALLMMATVWVAMSLVRRMWRTRQPSDAPLPPPGGLPKTRDGEPLAGVFDRRQRELFRRNNLYEPVRAAVRDLFASAGAPPNAGPKLPKVVIADVVHRPDTLRDALRELWQIAYGGPRVVTVQRWNLLEPLFDRVRQAHADGKWRFIAATDA